MNHNQGLSPNGNEGLGIKVATLGGEALHHRPPGDDQVKGCNDVSDAMSSTPRNVSNASSSNKEQENAYMNALRRMKVSRSCSSSSSIMPGPSAAFSGVASATLSNGITVSNADLAETLSLVNMLPAATTEGVALASVNDEITTNNINEGVKTPSPMAASESATMGVHDKKMVARDEELNKNLADGTTNTDQAMMPSPPPLTTTNWQPPPDLPPPINPHDERFLCPPPSHLATSCTSQTISDQTMTPHHGTDGITGRSGMGENVISHERNDAAVVVSSGLYGNLAPGSPDNKSNIAEGPTKKSDNKKALDGDIGEERAAQPQTNAHKQAGQGYEESDDEASLFGSSDDEDFEEMKPPEHHESQPKGDVPSSRSSSVHQAGQENNELSDDEASLFGSSDDDFEEPEPESQSEPKGDVPSSRGGQSEKDAGNDKIDVIDLSSMPTGENESGDESSTQGGFLGGILSKISTTQSKKRDLKSSGGKAGYTIQKKNTGKISNPDKKGDSSKLIRNMKPLPPQKRLPTAPESRAKNQFKTAGMKELKHDPQSKSSSKTVVTDTGPGTKRGKKVTLMAETTNDGKCLGKAARLLDGPVAPQKKSWKSRKKGDMQQSNKVGGSSTLASKQPATLGTALQRAPVKSPSKQKEWNRNFSLAKKYIAKHGNCEVPDGHSLSPWIQRQRNICQRWIRDAYDPNRELSDKNLERYTRIFELEKIGFDWGTASSKTSVRDALAAQSMNLSPSQRESLGMKRGSSRTAQSSHRTQSNKRKDLAISARRKKSVFDAISSKRQRSSSNGSNQEADSSDEEEFELSDSRAIGRRLNHDGKGGATAGNRSGSNTVSNSSEEGDHDDAVHVINKINSKKRLRSALEENDEARSVRQLVATSPKNRSPIDKKVLALALISSLTDNNDDYGEDENYDFIDDQPDFISWNELPKNLKKRRKGRNNVLGRMPSGQWVDLLVKCKRRLSSSTREMSTTTVEGHGKRWSKLEEAVGIGKSNIAGEKVHSKLSLEIKNTGQSSSLNGKKDAARAQGPKVRKNIKQTSATKSSMMKARTPLKLAKATLDNGTPIIQVGSKVFAAWWKTKSRSGPPYYYPGVVQSYNIVEKAGQNSSTVVYSINFDDGDRLSGIDGSLVIPRKKYIKQNLKPRLKVGEKVYSAWWEDKDRASPASYFPGVVKSRRELPYGGPYGQIRYYDILFDDGDELDNIQDLWVERKSEYLLSTLKSVDDGDSKDDDTQPKWIGVKNKLDIHCIKDDDWAKEVGWYVATIDGQEKSFALLSGALRAYDAYTVQCKGARTERSHLNLPDEWAFPSPFGICSPVHIGGGADDEDQNTSPNANASSKSQAASTASCNRKRKNLKAANTKTGSPTTFSTWTCNHCGNANSNLHKKTRCSACKEWKGGKREEFGSSKRIVIGIDDNNDGTSIAGRATSSSKRDRFTQGNDQKPSIDAASDAGLPPSNQAAPTNTSHNCQQKNETNSDSSKHAASTALCNKMCSPNLDVSSSGQNKDDDELVDEATNKSAISVTADKSESQTVCNDDKGKQMMPMALGDTRSTTKAIINLIDVTKPDTAPKSTVKCFSQATVDATAETLSSSLSTFSDRESHSPAMPSEDFQNWTVRKILRADGSCADTYYYSPQKGYRFRSKPEVCRYMACLKRTDGDEALAMKDFRSPSRQIVSTITGPESFPTSAPHAREAKQATAVLGDSRSSTKNILCLLDLTNPVVPTSSTKNISNTTIDALTARSTQSTQKSSSISHPTVSNRESRFPAMPSEHFQNWTVRKIPRAKGSHVDTFYYSPQKGYRFRSKPEVCRYMACLKRTGDEELAIEEFRVSRKGSKRPPNESSSTRVSLTKASQSRYKVLEYVEPCENTGVKQETKNCDTGKGLKKVNTKETVPNPGSSSAGHVKPVIKKGERVYACWSGPDRNGRDWFPGRVWDIKEYPGGKYGPIKKYDVVFDDGDVESDIGEMWVSKKAEYEVCLKKPEEEWIGVRNVCEESEDEYVRTIGWYETTRFTGVYSSLSEALRAHDKHIIEIRGRADVSAAELNFPEEHFNRD